jgi:uncharacterized protein (DUF1501 family)
LSRRIAFATTLAGGRQPLDASGLDATLGSTISPRTRAGPAAAMNLANGAAGVKAMVLDKPDVGAAFDQPLPNGFPDDAARLAQLMRSDAKIQLAFVALGGWDTHASQGGATGQLANHLAPLAQGLAVLAQRLGPLCDDTTIVVMSEFGRTARENGNGGTDHGHGNATLVLGGGVSGGKVLGEWAEKHLRLGDKQLAALFPALPHKRLGFELIQA